MHLPALSYADLPRLFLITLDLPTFPEIVENLSPNWRNPAYYQDNYQSIKSWLNNPDPMALKVPSAVVAASYNVLLHPPHKDYAEIEVLNIEPFLIDPRLWHIS